MGVPVWGKNTCLPSETTEWTATYSHKGENVVVEITVLKDGVWGDSPLVIPFRERLGGIRMVTCTPEMDVVVTDRFARFPIMGQPRKADDTILLRFGAHTIDDTSISANTPAVQLTALRFAGKNRPELEKALEECDASQRADMEFLIANMPERDLQELDAAFLLENVAYARKALDKAPWKDQIDEALYRDCILPYANLSEKRERWRKSFHDQFKPTVEGITDPGEAAIKLNCTIYDQLNVHYHATKRPRPDQGPLESIEAGYASCTGLSILLVDACRAVGIPARVAGVAQWTDNPGNHTWVEIWDDQWRCIGAAESKTLDDVWFGPGTAKADESDPLRRIYAVKFSRDTLRFPMVWNPYADYVSAVDVTARYKKLFKKTSP